MKKTDEEIDSDLMDELLDAMSGRDAESLKAPAAHVIEIHIKPAGAASEPVEMDDEDEEREGMLPNSAELDAMMKKGRK